MKILKMIVVAGLALGLSALVYADQTSDTAKHCDYKKHGLQDADTNKDGAISHDEFIAAHQARSEEMFAMMDANHDGKIDLSERQAMKVNMPSHCKRHGAKMDGKQDATK